MEYFHAIIAVWYLTLLHKYCVKQFIQHTRTNHVLGVSTFVLEVSLMSNCIVGQPMPCASCVCIPTLNTLLPQSKYTQLLYSHHPLHRTCLGPYQASSAVSSDPDFHSGTEGLCLRLPQGLTIIKPPSSALKKKNRRRCYAKSPTAQDTIWLIPGFISCGGVIRKEILNLVSNLKTSTYWNWLKMSCAHTIFR